MGKDGSQGSEHGMALFACRGEIATDDAKGRNPFFTAKGSRNLLLNFDRAQVSFGEIIEPGDGVAGVLGVIGDALDDALQVFRGCIGR